MDSREEIHIKAMDFLDDAIIARRNNNIDEAHSLYLQAFELECEAANMLKDEKGYEPTRGILYRSAATLALECEKVREAEKLASEGLAGEPFDDIAQELREVFDKANFHRHLELKGIVLQPDEFQVSLSGPSVGYGITHSSEVMFRVDYIEKMLIRTAERKAGKDFRIHGRIEKKIQDKFELFLSIPRAASFAITFRVGSLEQIELPGIGDSTELVREVIDCLDLYNKEEFENLKERISNEEYFENFIGLADNILPDGDNIKTVGFTAIRENSERSICFSKIKERLPREKSHKTTTQERKIEIEGRLCFADSRDEKKGIIEVETSDGISQKIKVSPAQMADIVRPMYEYNVLVVGKQKGKMIVMESIRRI